MGAALIQIILAQNRSAGSNEAWRVARSVSRGSLNRLLADLRLAEPNGALDGTTVSGQDMTLRVPYAFGVACNANNITGPGLTVSLLPVDPTRLGAHLFRRLRLARRLHVGLHVPHHTGNGAALLAPSSNPSICVQPGYTISTSPGGSGVNLTASTIGRAAYLAG